MGLSFKFEDEESFKEAAGSLRFNNFPSDHNALQQVGSMLPQDFERNEDICFNIPPSDPNTLQRLAVGSNSNMPAQERSEDICFNNPPGNPNTLQQMERSSSMPPQEMSEDT